MAVEVFHVTPHTQHDRNLNVAQWCLCYDTVSRSLKPVNWQIGRRLFIVSYVVIIKHRGAGSLAHLITRYTACYCFSGSASVTYSDWLSWVFIAKKIANIFLRWDFCSSVFFLRSSLNISISERVCSACGPTADTTKLSFSSSDTLYCFQGIHAAMVMSSLPNFSQLLQF